MKSIFIIIHAEEKIQQESKKCDLEGHWSYNGKMKIIAALGKIKWWFLRFLQVQLFITAISFPILVSWGLPISLVSPLGNLIFFPILFLFLLLSSVIFFLELLYLPNQFFIFCLEKLTACWINLLSIGGSTQFLVGFGKPPLFFLLLIPACACGILYNKHTKPIVRSTILLATLLGISFGMLKLFCCSKNFVKQLDYNGGHVTLVHSDGQTVVIDPGVIGRKPSASSWVQYTLAPEITSTTGKHAIDHLIIMQPSIRTFEAIEVLCRTMQINTIFLVSWNGTLKKNGWRTFFHLRRAAQQQGIRFARIGKRKLLIPLGSKNKLIAKPIDGTQHYHDATYPVLCISGQIDNQTFTIYSAKHEQKKEHEKQ